MKAQVLKQVEKGSVVLSHTSTLFLSQSSQQPVQKDTAFWQSSRLKSSLAFLHQLLSTEKSSVCSSRLSDKLPRKRLYLFVLYFSVVLTTDLEVLCSPVIKHWAALKHYKSSPEPAHILCISWKVLGSIAWMGARSHEGCSVDLIKPCEHEK